MDKEGFGAYISQLNFATHCASTAVASLSEHLLAEDDMIRSIYRFHVVFQTWKILNTLGVKLPYIDEFDPFKSGITSRATGSFAMSLTFIQRLIGDTSTMKRDLFKMGRQGTM